MGQAFVMWEMRSDGVEVVEEDKSSEDGDRERVGYNDSERETELSLNARSGASRPSIMRLLAWVGKHEVSLLVDNGSSYNFVNVKLLQRVGFKKDAIEPFDVKVVKGEKLKCEVVVKDAKMNVQGVRIFTDLYVLAMEGRNVVQENVWLKSVRKVTTDYQTMTMEFILGGKKRSWIAVSTREVKSCEANVLEK